MERKNSVKTILLISSADSNAASSLIIPLMGIFAVMFPGSDTQISMLISLPSLIMVPVILMTGKLSRYYSKKTLLNIGAGLFFIGGFAGCLWDNLAFILLTRVINGIGCGMIYPLVPALIAYFFDGDEQTKMMGWANAAGSIIAMLVSLSSGFLALLNWRYPFIIMLLYALLLIAQIRVLPNIPPEKDDTTLPPCQGRMPHMGWLIYVTAFAAFVFFSISMVWILKISIFIESEGLGNAANAGMASSIVAGTAFFFSMTFPYVYRLINRFTSIICLISLAACFFLMGQAQSFRMIIFSSICMGCSLGYIIPYMNMRVSTIASLQSKTCAFSLVCSAIYLGQFFAAFYFGGIQLIVGDSLRGAFYAIAENLVVCTVIALLFILFSWKYDRKFSKRGSVR